MAWHKLKDDELPQSAQDFLNEYEHPVLNRKIEFHAPWFEAYYEGKDVDKATNWIIVVWDGSYYKVGATFMTWHRCITGKVVGKCNWSKNALFKTIQAIKKGEPVPFDPNYQT
ncbi:MAG TPA: hypothetical protein VMW50_10100 [Dehalococcoidia bacterium]|jgi:hypothetical protein|nr:hypothetical protein [Dehalococcoidia bacterium]